LKKIAVAFVALAVLVLAPAGTAKSTKHKAVCPKAFAAAACDALVVTDASGVPLASPTPRADALSPAKLQSAYGLPSATSGAGQTIAITIAFHDPNIENDLNVYSSTYGLPACTTANGCFSQVNQNGGSNFKRYRTDGGWALELAMDVQVAHAICPNCKILVVEGRTNSFSDLLSAVDTAAANANVVNGSWGAGEFSSETSYDGHFNRPGIAFTFSSGDSGYRNEYPTSSQYVTSVGGTTLTLNANGTRASETVWSGAGSGCSAYESKPSWQSSATQCSRRATSDVSADADPATGASVYSSVNYSGGTGWYKVGGTSLAAPLVAGVYALAGHSGPGVSTFPASFPWTSGGLFDVVSGSNGSCSPSLWCNGGPGWDGPSGLGSPNGTAGF
jgi:subtilase family serine protease